MRERPILFSGPMVRAILAGRKTVTRRVLQPQPPEDDAPLATGWFHPEASDGGPGPHTFGVYGSDWHVRCPYGAPNDRLWVREAWAARDVRSEWALSVGLVEEPFCGVGGDEIIYRADDDGTRARPPRWFSPLYMPRWASRLTLEIVSVRVERLQEIAEADARAEGCGDPPFGTRRETFAILWDAINGKRAPWESNPWVWRVEFRRVT